MLLTLSSIHGLNYLDRLFETHLKEPRDSISDNDVASATAFVSKRFEDKDTQHWPEISVEWFMMYLITEVGVTPHADRQGYNAPSLDGAYQDLIQEFVSLSPCYLILLS